MFSGIFVLLGGKLDILLSEKYNFPSHGMDVDVNAIYKL